MNSSPIFTLLPMLPAVEEPDGRVLLTRKFVDGLERYHASWPGRLVVLLEPTAQATDNLDNISR